MIDVIRYFKEFYQRNNVPVDSISQREFGVGIDKKINYRHKAFSTQREFNNFLANEPPRFVSHSVGRFEFPWCQPMEKKSLLSADLVFDIDSKPEEGHNDIFCTKCIERAKIEVVKLIENFLLSEFGLSQKDLLVVFSGSKGFHVHVRSPAVQQLSSTSRRLLVDCITGKELNLDSLVRRTSVGGKAYTLNGPAANSLGWKKQLLETSLAFLEKPDFPKKKLLYLQENKQNITDQLNLGNWDFFHDSREALEQILSLAIAKRGVDVDSPVTFDVHRLIRVPGTLHGDTGFVAKPLSITEIDKFDATIHAAAFKGTAQVELTVPASLYFAGQEYSLNTGKSEVPTSLAVLLTCKGATL